MRYAPRQEPKPNHSQRSPRSRKLSSPHTSLNAQLSPCAAALPASLSALSAGCGGSGGDVDGASHHAEELVDDPVPVVAQPAMLVLVGHPHLRREASRGRADGLPGNPRSVSPLLLACGVAQHRTHSSLPDQVRTDPHTRPVLRNTASTDQSDQYTGPVLNSTRGQN